MRANREGTEHIVQPKPVRAHKKRERGVPPIPTRLPGSLVVDPAPYGVCGVTATGGCSGRRVADRRVRASW